MMLNLQGIFLQLCTYSTRDKHICYRLDLISVSKNNTPSFILLPPDCRTAIDILLDTRSNVGIFKSNNYIFAQLNYDTPISVKTEIRDVLNACSLLEDSDLIMTDKFRKYFGCSVTGLIIIYIS